MGRIKELLTPLLLPCPFQIRVTPVPGKRVEHQGIKVQLIGRIELASERGVRHDFLSLARELAPPGDLASTRAFPFEFRNVEMQYDSYRGIQVRCRSVACCCRHSGLPLLGDRVRNGLLVWVGHQSTFQVGELGFEVAS